MNNNGRFQTLSRVTLENKSESYGNGNGLGDGAVLLVANFESGVGYAWWLMENFWVLIAQQVALQGRKCFLAYPAITTIPDTIIQAPIEIVKLDSSDRSLRGCWRFLWFLHSHKVHSLYLTDKRYLDWYYILLRFIGIKNIVLHDHTPGDRPLERGIKGWLKAAIHKIGVLSCDRYVAVSDFVRQRMIDNARVPENKCVTVRNGIVPNVCIEGEREYVRNMFGFASNSVVVLLVGRASEYKGIDFAIRCAAQFYEKYPDVQKELVFLHCGQGPDLNRFRSDVEAMGFSDTFVFAGHRDDVRRIMCGCDFAFHPSRGEALSLAILEFMSSGLPVIVPDRPSVCTPISNGITGLIYEKENIDSAVKCMERLYRDKYVRLNIGKSAKREIEDRYSLNATNESFMKKVAIYL